MKSVHLFVCFVVWVGARLWKSFRRVLHVKAFNAFYRLKAPGERVGWMRKLRESGRIDGVDRGSQPCKILALNSSDGMPLLESPHTSTQILARCPLYMKNSQPLQPRAFFSIFFLSMFSSRWYRRLHNVCLMAVPLAYSDSMTRPPFYLFMRCAVTQTSTNTHKFVPP